MRSDSSASTRAASQLTFHLQYAKQYGATRQELIEAITHLAFYTGWTEACRR